MARLTSTRTAIISGIYLFLFCSLFIQAAIATTYTAEEWPIVIANYNQQPWLDERQADIFAKLSDATNEYMGDRVLFCGSDYYVAHEGAVYRNKFVQDISRITDIFLITDWNLVEQGANIWKFRQVHDLRDTSQSSAGKWLSRSEFSLSPAQAANLPDGLVAWADFRTYALISQEFGSHMHRKKWSDWRDGRLTTQIPTIFLFQDRAEIGKSLNGDKATPLNQPPIEVVDWPKTPWSLRSNPSFLPKEFAELSRDDKCSFIEGEKVVAKRPSSRKKDASEAYVSLQDSFTYGQEVWEIVADLNSMIGSELENGWLFCEDLVTLASRGGSGASQYRGSINPAGTEKRIYVSEIEHSTGTYTFWSDKKAGEYNWRLSPEFKSNSGHGFRFEISIDVNEVREDGIHFAWGDWEEGAYYARPKQHGRYKIKDGSLEAFIPERLNRDIRNIFELKKEYFDQSESLEYFDFEAMSIKERCEYILD